MKLKISELYIGFKNKSFKIYCNDLPKRGTVYKDNLITGIISLENRNNYYRLTGKVKAKTEYICVRCLRNFSFNVNQQVNILMLSDTERHSSDTNIDIIVINKSCDYVDLTEIFADLIALSEPIKPLCHEECSGICSNCGIERSSNCSCDYQKDTSAWDKLKEIQI